MRKFNKRAQIISFGPPKSEEKDKDKEKNGEKTKEDENLPKTCPRCNVWIVEGMNVIDPNLVIQLLNYN